MIITARFQLDSQDDAEALMSALDALADQYGCFHEIYQEGAAE